MASRTSPQDALADACARAGLDASGASVLYDRSNTVYKIAGEPVVVRLRYAPGSGAWRDRLATSVQVTGWLHEQGFPAVRPLDIPQPETTWTLGRGMIHGDAWTDNVIHTRDGAVLADWDSVSYGPREQDIVPASIRHRFGRPLTEWREFCAAYGTDPDSLPGLDMLRQMRELRTLVPYIRSTGKPEVQAEVSRRIADLMSGTQPEPWQALNLVS